MGKHLKKQDFLWKDIRSKHITTEEEQIFAVKGDNNLWGFYKIGQDPKVVQLIWEDIQVDTYNKEVLFKKNNLWGRVNFGEKTKRRTLFLE